MIETLISSKTRIKLLLKFFLNSNTTAYLRGLEEEFGESTNSIRLELNRFEKAGFKIVAAKMVSPDYEHFYEHYEGIGTLIYANEYQHVRRAMKKDIRSILMLTKTSVANAELMKRTRASIEKQLGDYYIFEIDKNPVACVALHAFPEQGKGELAYLYVSPSHENQGIGRKLIQFVENKARELGLNELIALSTQAFTYFQSKGGFSEGASEDLPPTRREKYEQSGRNSKVLVKKLANLGWT